MSEKNYINVRVPMAFPNSPAWHGSYKYVREKL